VLDKAFNATPAGRPAVGYLRRSTDRQEQSLADQRRAIVAYAEQHGYEILHWFEDDAISGASVEGRSGFKKMLEDARSPQRDWRYILVYDVSRFSRGGLDEAGHVRYQFKQAGVEIVYCTEGFSGSDSDDLVRGVRQWQAQQYVKDLSKVTIRGLLSLSEGGWWMGGLPPYGFDLLYHDSTGTPYQRVRFLPTGEKQIFSVGGDLVRTVARGERLSTSKSDRARLVASEPRRVQTVKRIFEMYADLCMGLRAIAYKLNDERIPSPGCANPKSNRDFTWCLSSVRGILQNPVYTGDLTWNKTTQAKFHRIANGQAQKRETVRRVIEKNGQHDWIVVPRAHEALVSRTLFERALSRRSDESRTKDNFRRGRGKDSPFLFTGLLVCEHCGFKLQGHTRHTGYHTVEGDETLSFSYVCGGYRSKGRRTCKSYYLRRDPFENFILGRVEKRLQKYLARGGMALLRKFIAEEITSKLQDPQEEIGRIKSELARLQVEADRLLDVMTPATADFVGERLGKVRVQRQTLESRLADLERVDYHPIDLEAATREALAYLGRFREVLDSGTLEQRKEFLRGFVHEIAIDPDAGRGVITFYELPAGSLMMVPGPGVEPGWPEGQGILRRRERGSEYRASPIRCLSPCPRSPRRVVESGDYGHPDGHLSLDLTGFSRVVFLLFESQLIPSDVAAENREGGAPAPRAVFPTPTSEAT
jgi:site-specific DNA recombinase